jgi:hypothetical protein
MSATSMMVADPYVVRVSEVRFTCCDIEMEPTDIELRDGRTVGFCPVCHRTRFTIEVAS